MQYYYILTENVNTTYVFRESIVQVITFSLLMCSHKQEM